MKTEHKYPPNFDKILEVLDIGFNSDIIFTYGDTCYIPGGGELTPDLEVHERTHTRQQADRPDVWWEKYLADTQFRLDQEVEAYREQLKYVNEHYNRRKRRAALESFANTLASKMYGNMVTVKEAKLLLTGR